MLKIILQWFSITRTWFTGKPAECYVDPLIIKEDMNEIHAQALLMDKQRSLLLKLREEKKHVLEGYIPPKPTIGNRIDIHMERAGVMGKEKESRFGPSVKPAIKDHKKTARN